MNYKSQLNGWAVEMVIKAKDAGYDMGSNMADLLSNTEKLVDYAFSPRKALESHIEEILDMVRSAPANESKIDALIGTLEHIKQDRLSQGIDTDENATKETVQ